MGHFPRRTSGERKEMHDLGKELLMPKRETGPCLYVKAID